MGGLDFATGSGFLEVFYRDALAVELGLRAIPFESEVACGVMCHQGGLLLTFGASKLEYGRFILTKPR